MAHLLLELSTVPKSGFICKLTITREGPDAWQYEKATGGQKVYELRTMYGPIVTLAYRIRRHTYLFDGIVDIPLVFWMGCSFYSCANTMSLL